MIALALESGWIALDRVVGDHVEVFLPPEHNESLKDSFAHYVKKSLPPDEWHAVRDDAWEDASRERWGSTDE